MELKYKLDENGQMSFFQIPKFLMTNPKYKKISCEAKFIYGLMLDRMKLSIKNKWIDQNNRTFIIFTNNEIAEMICCGVKKVINLIKELKSFGLIETKRVGLTKPNMIYIKQIIEQKKSTQKTSNEASNTRQRLNNELNSKKIEKIKSNCDLKSSIEKRKEEYQTIHNNTNRTNNNLYEKYKSILKANISYECLINDYATKRSEIDELVELMTEVAMSNKKYINISGDKISI